MTEVFEHNPDDHDDPAAGPTWLTSAVGVFLLVATVLGVTALYYNVKATKVQTEVISRPYDAITEMREEQLAQLQGPARKVTRIGENGEPVEVYVIPIERAMDIVAQEHQRQ